MQTVIASQKDKKLVLTTYDFTLEKNLKCEAYLSIMSPVGVQHFGVNSTGDELFISFLSDFLKNKIRIGLKRVALENSKKFEILREKAKNKKI